MCLSMKLKCLVWLKGSQMMLKRAKKRRESGCRESLDPLFSMITVKMKLVKNMLMCPVLMNLVKEEPIDDLRNLLGDYQWARNKTRREIREPIRMNDYMSLVVLSYQDLAFKESKSYEEAVSCQLSKEW